MSLLRNQHLSLDFDLVPGNGIALANIVDEHTQYPFLTHRSMLFEYAVDNRTARQSDTTLNVELLPGSGANSFSVVASAHEEAITFRLDASLAPNAVAAAIQLSVTNQWRAPIFLRMVLPKISGIVTRGERSEKMGAIPTEMGSVAPLYDPDPTHPPVTLGMPFNINIGLPKAMNNMEVATIYDGTSGHGIFFADVESDLSQGVAPLQFNLSEQEVVAFWIGTLAPQQTISLPKLAIGITHSDWHEAVDVYNAAHSGNRRSPSIPRWFREAGAIYACPPFGAGSIYLAYPSPTLADGAVWNTWEDNNSTWRDGEPKTNHGIPVQVSGAGFARAGAHLACEKQSEDQIDVFAVGNDGAINVTWEVGGNAWRDSRNGRFSASVTPPGVASPGAPLVAYRQPDNELDVFYVGPDQAVWVTFKGSDSAWRDGIEGRFPIRISPPHFTTPEGHLAAAKQRDGQFCVFATGYDGAIWCTFSDRESALGTWTDGNDGRMPVRVTPPGLAPPGAPVVAAQQSANQLNAFVVGYDGAIWVTWERDGFAWRDGNDSRDPRRITEPEFAPVGAHLAAARQREDQLDIFVVGVDGGVWVGWERGGSAWQPMKRITLAGFAVPGAPLAAAFQRPNRWNIFVVQDGGIWLTWEDRDEPWTDGVDGRPGPVRVTQLGIAPNDSDVAAIERNSSHMDAFVVGSGRIRSFRELPRLLVEARALGTEVLYLNDYWEGSDEGGDPPYWNKGDYIPRGDLGGASALIDGIRDVHSAGGRVVVYVEPFIIYMQSLIGKGQGEAWAGYDPNWRRYDEYEDYPGSFTMLAPFSLWQKYLLTVVERLVGVYDVDGIYLDSYGWQMNRRIQNQQEKLLYSSLEYTQGVLQLVDRIRATVQRLKPDGVVLGETTAGPIAQCWDGGLAADFNVEFLPNVAHQYGLIASPTRYGLPDLNVFGNGNDINELHQVYAAGFGLALCNYFPGSFMFDFSDHIRALVDARKTHKDALIYGNQTHQPRTGNSAVIAYYYQGSRECVITIVNIAPTDQAATVTLPANDSDSTWIDTLTGVGLTAAGTDLGPLNLRTGTEGIQVLVKRWESL